MVPGKLWGALVDLSVTAVSHDTKMSPFSTVYMTCASQAAAEILYMRGLLREMGVVLRSPTVLYVDNSGAVAMSKDLKSCQRSRHIERRYLKVRELVAQGEVEVRYCPTKDTAPLRTGERSLRTYEVVARCRTPYVHLHRTNTERMRLQCSTRERLSNRPRPLVANVNLQCGSGRSTSRLRT